MINSDCIPLTARRAKWWRFGAHLRHIIGKKHWLDKEFKYYGKMRKCTGENFDSIQLEDVKHPINKRLYKKFNDSIKR